MLAKLAPLAALPMWARQSGRPVRYLAMAGGLVAVAFLPVLTLEAQEVRQRPGLGVNELAAAMSVRQPTASNLVKNLTQQGLIEVRREGPDRRAVQLHILPEGRRVLRRAPGPFAGVLPEALASRAWAHGTLAELELLALFHKSAAKDAKRAGEMLVEVLLQQLRGIAARPAIDPVELLATVVLAVTAATPTVVVPTVVTQGVRFPNARSARLCWA